MPAATSARHQAPVATGKIDRPRGVWVIYDEKVPRIPGRYVARKFLVGKVFCFEVAEEFRADTVADLRKLLPDGLMNIRRDKHDPASVVETWA